MKNITLSLISIFVLSQSAMALDVTPVKTDDPQQAEVLQKETPTTKPSIEVRREELKKKHKAKKAAKKAAAEQAATAASTPAPVPAIATPEAANLSAVKAEQKDLDQREDNKNKTH